MNWPGRRNACLLYALLVALIGCDADVDASSRRSGECQKVGGELAED